MPTIHEKILKLRSEFLKHQLNEKEVEKDPFKQFSIWLHEASLSEIKDYHAMDLATVDRHCRPSARIVLLRSFDENGFVFFTNYKSMKGKNIELNPRVCLNFFWPELERQIKIDGEAKKIPGGNSDLYFSTRPRESQIGAWVSNQSRVISDRTVLEKKFRETEKKYKGIPIPRPPNWGGYVVKPFEFEFWQGRPNRLHDRLRFQLKKDKWVLARLSP